MILIILNPEVYSNGDSKVSIKHLILVRFFYCSMHVEKMITSYLKNSPKL